MRPISMTDAPAHRAGEDAELVRWPSGRPGTPASVRAYIGRAIAH
ncbi:hypothetical protein [Haloechinothrix aidingensis]|nr:hypothetical protein [Haloechinothrix aidingensis]